MESAVTATPSDANIDYRAAHLYVQAQNEKLIQMLGNAEKALEESGVTCLLRKLDEAETALDEMDAQRRHAKENAEELDERLRRSQFILGQYTPKIENLRSSHDILVQYTQHIEGEIVKLRRENEQLRSQRPSIQEFSVGNDAEVREKPNLSSLVSQTKAGT